MANAMPQAIGAQAVDKKRQVVAMWRRRFPYANGDSLSQMQVPVKIIIHNNGARFCCHGNESGRFLNSGNSLHNLTLQRLRMLRVSKGSVLKKE